MTCPPLENPVADYDMDCHACMQTVAPANGCNISSEVSARASYVPPGTLAGAGQELRFI